MGGPAQQAAANYRTYSKRPLQETCCIVHNSLHNVFPGMPFGQKHYIIKIVANLIDVTRYNTLHHENCQEFI